MYCSVLQSVAVYCSLLQCIVVCCSVLQSAAVPCVYLHLSFPLTLCLSGVYHCQCIDNTLQHCMCCSETLSDADAASICSLLSRTPSLAGALSHTLSFSLSFRALLLAYSRPLYLAPSLARTQSWCLPLALSVSHAHTLSRAFFARTHSLELSLRAVPLACLYRTVLPSLVQGLNGNFSCSHSPSPLSFPLSLPLSRALSCSFPRSHALATYQAKGELVVLGSVAGIDDVYDLVRGPRVIGRCTRALNICKKSPWHICKEPYIYMAHYIIS